MQIAWKTTVTAALVGTGKAKYCPPIVGIFALSVGEGGMGQASAVNNTKAMCIESINCWMLAAYSVSYAGDVS